LHSLKINLIQHLDHSAAAIKRQEPLPAGPELVYI